MTNSLYIPPYKLTHKNHPCAVWVRESLDNYKWLVILGKELCKEYTYRYGKIHKCEAYIDSLSENVPPLESIGFTKPAQAMPDEYKGRSSIKAYRRYYTNGKRHLHSWKGKVAGRPLPPWYKTN